MKVILLVAVLMCVVLFGNVSFANSLAQIANQKVVSLNKNSLVKKRKFRVLTELFEQRRAAYAKSDISNVDPCQMAVPIIYGQTINGNLASSDCNLGDNSYIDFYSFNARAGQIVTIQQTSTQFDSFLLIIKNNVTIALDDDSGGGTNSRIRFTLLTNGVYIIGANSFDPLSTGNYSVTLTAEPSILRTKFDFDADGKADLAVFRPNNGTWYLSQSTAGFASLQFGLPTDKPVAADYDGDGKTDIAVYRDGNWFIQRSSDNILSSVNFGLPTDKPVPADYDGDGRADIAVYRPSNGIWYILGSSDGNLVSQQFGLNTDIPVPADYDGDGRTDIAVYRSSAQTWYIQQSQSNSLRTLVTFSSRSTPPMLVPADYNGDGQDDVAVWKPHDGEWLIYANDYPARLTDGLGSLYANDKFVPADYDGDGKADPAVWRPNNSIWDIRRSSEFYGDTERQFGVSGDVPIPLAPK